MATTGYALPALPPKQSRAGLNFLQKEDLKQEFRKTLIELIRVAPPQSLGVLYLGNPLQARKDYVDALIKLLEQKPYLVAELDKENGKTSRISYSEFTKSDKQWVRQVLEEETKKLRLKMDDTAFKSRLVPTENKGWLEFRTVDCVFAAMLAALGFQPGKARVNVSTLRVTNKDAYIQNAEKEEKEAEEWLAKQLNFAQRVTPDVALIYVLEEQFGWKRVADGALISQFKVGKASPSSFIITYQRSGDDWHTIFMDHPGASTWTVIDRQATGLGMTGVNDNGLCDAWQVDTATPGFTKLRTAWNEYQNG